MKNIFLGLLIAATTIGSCNNDTNNTTDVKKADEKNDTAMANHQQVPIDTATSQIASVNSKASFPVKEIMAGYLQLKNALTKDNAKDAATAGNAMIATLASVDMKSLPDVQMKKYMDLADDLKEHAEHIGANAGKIEHQREHFVMMSKDITDLIKTFGNGGQTLYKDFCPMADNGKGAVWISEIKEIKNPYYGKSMSSCGSIKETIN